MSMEDLDPTDRDKILCHNAADLFDLADAA